MVFLNTGGSSTWPAWVATATAATETLDAVPISPESKTKEPSLTPTLVALISNTVPPSTVQWQVSTVNTFATTVWTGSQSNVADGVRSILVTTSLTSGTTYFWRVRTGDTAGTTFGAWSAAIEFVPDTNMGRAYQDVYENVGREVASPERGTVDVYENVGIDDRVVLTGTDYVFGNVGVVIPSNPPASEYMYWGDVSSNTPVPHIWWLKPSSGRPGDGIQIVCFGAGDLQATFNGQVEIYMGATGGWQSVSVNTWQVFPPTANAYTGLRTLDEAANVIDMQHQIIEITVPSGAVPPGYPLRIRTDGP